MIELISSLYVCVLKPILFLFDPETVHEFFTGVGAVLARYKFTRELTSKIFEYKNLALEKTINGIKFNNPIGLAAGYDYEANTTAILKSVGFGFNTVGTVTAKPYDGNEKPRLTRLPKSKSILVNKGFKSKGVYEINKRLNNSIFKNINLGVSVGSSNIPEIDTIAKAIGDYIESFKELEKNPYIKYYELNISCPNTSMTENFTNVANYEKLLSALDELKITRPIFVKMPNEIQIDIGDELVKMSLKHHINSFIFSNLVKNRENKCLDKNEIEKVKNLKGNFSGLPTKEGSLNLIKYFRNTYKDEIVLIGCGGIFTPQDAKERLDAGADLIQLITGMIYEGPTLINKINKYLAKAN